MSGVSNESCTMSFVVQLLAVLVATIGSGCQAYSYSNAGVKLIVEPFIGNAGHQLDQQRNIGTTQQRVLLFNVHRNAPLAPVGLRDPDRRQVAIEKSPHDSGNFTRMIEWRLLPVANGKYAIMHHHFNEPLYALDGKEYDTHRRDVLTWLPGLEQGDRQSWWEIIPRTDGFYLIKNVRFGEYLQGTDIPSKEKVFTWRKGNADLEDRKFHWDIININ
uniref:Putative 16 kDa salivary protein n=1 Tax=Psorophora albipes TaxID=869069 RepID=T1D4Q2_9DIPT